LSLGFSRIAGGVYAGVRHPFAFLAKEWPGSPSAHVVARSGNHGHFAVWLARGPDGDLYILPKGSEKVHEALDGKGTRAVAHQGRDVRLLDAQDLSGFGLCEAASFPEAAALHQAVNLQRELGFQKLLFWMGKAQVSKNISTAFLYSDFL